MRTGLSALWRGDPRHFVSPAEFWQLLAVSGLARAANLSTPLTLVWLIHSVLRPDSQSISFIPFAFVLAAGLFNFVLSRVQRSYQQKIIDEVHARATSHFFSKSIEQNLCITKPSYQKDVFTASVALSVSSLIAIVSITSAIIFIVTFILILSLMNIILTSILLFINTIIFIFMYADHISATEQYKIASVGRDLNESAFVAGKILRGSVISAAILDRIIENSRVTRMEMQDRYSREKHLDDIISFLQNAATTLIIAVGSALIHFGHLTIGLLFAFILLSNRAYAPMRVIVESYRSWSRRSQHLAKLRASEKLKREQYDSASMLIAIKGGNAHIENVSPAIQVDVQPRSMNDIRYTDISWNPKQGSSAETILEISLQTFPSENVAMLDLRGFRWANFLLVKDILPSWIDEGEDMSSEIELSALFRKADQERILHMGLELCHRSGARRVALVLEGPLAPSSLTAVVRERIQEFDKVHLIIVNVGKK